MERYAALNGVQNDLGTARDLAKVIESGRLLKRRMARNRAWWSLESVNTAALIRYGRCFDTGRSGHAIPTAVMQKLPGELPRWHDRFTFLRDKHIAHAIGIAESCTITINATDREGEIHIDDLSCFAVSFASISPEEAAQLVALCDAGVMWVEQSIRSIAPDVLAYARGLSQSELRHLQGALTKTTGQRKTTGQWEYIDQLIARSSRKPRKDGRRGP
jgi:hypothetical protein